MQANLAVTLTNQTEPEKFWVKLVQDRPGEKAAMQEAAETIDKMFNLDPCTPVDEAETVSEKIENHVKTQEEVAARKKQAEEWLYNYLYRDVVGLCRDGASWEATVYVARSDNTRPYTILVSGGDVVRTISGNLIEIDNVMMPSDKVTIKVTGEDCTVTALYHLSTDQIELEPPPDDDATLSVCKEVQTRYEIPETGGNCYKQTDHDIRCNCSNSPSGDSYTTYSPAPCGDNAPGSTVERETVVSYKVCDEQEKVSDPEYYKKICCDPPPFPLPRCKTTYSIWNGTGISSEALENLYATYGKHAQIIGVGPAEGYCGKFITSQIIDQKSCCDGVDPLEITDKSSESIAPGQSVRIDIDGDTGTIEWEVNGGYSLAWDVTSTPGYNIVTMDAAESCYAASINITGLCSRVNTRLTRPSVPPFTLSVANIEPVANNATVIISGGLPPYTLTIDEEDHATFSNNGLKTIVLGGEGSVGIAIETNQQCDGAFDVLGVDNCIEQAQTTIQPIDWLGNVCATYTASTYGLDGQSPLVPPVEVAYGYVEPAVSGLARDTGQVEGSYYVCWGGCQSTPPAVAHYTVVRIPPMPDEEPMISWTFRRLQQVVRPPQDLECLVC